VRKGGIRLSGRWESGVSIGRLRVGRIDESYRGVGIGFAFMDVVERFPFLRYA
jgi:hypothetical protein